MRKNIQIFFKGFVMGVAEIIPGVSGSTLALVMGIYEKFIELLFQVSNFFKEVVLFLIFRSSLENLIKRFKEINWYFGIFLFLGMLFAILSLSNLMHFLLDSYKEYVLAFFFGLVLSSIVVPWNEIKQKDYKSILLVLFSAVICFLLLSLKPYEFATLPHPFYFFIAGSIAICAMVLPGISGSFVFLIFGVYEFIVSHISNITKLNIQNIEILNLSLLFLGIVFGFSVFVRILKKGLQKNSSVIFALLTGLMIASLRVLWPYAELSNNSEILSLSITAVVGFGVVFFLRKLS